MNPTLSRHLPSCCVSASRFPYVGKISVGKKDVNFIYQFVKKNEVEYVNAFNYKEHYITGIPIKFPTYEDFPQAFSMRTYGFDISTYPWQDERQLDYTIEEYGCNQVDILFHEAVYPIRVSVYEIYNPGNIIRISAQDSDNQWFVLWNGSPQIVPPASRLFSPPLESCYFKTKMLRLQFKLSLWDYYTKIDAVMLIGTSKLILPRNPEESITDLLKRIKCIHFYHENEDVHNLTTDYKNVHLDIVHLQQNFDEYCISYESDMEIILPRPFTEKHSRRLLLKNDLYSVTCMNPIWNEFKESSRYSLSDLSVKYFLKDEIILEILKNLDLMTLCHLNQVNKRFYCLIQDSVLYKRLNVRNIDYANHNMNMYNIFCYFTPRCKNLLQLDLTSSNFSVLDFVRFLRYCGSRLTHLRLSMCAQVDNFTLLKISKTCKNLKHLDLHGCTFIRDKGFSYLEKLRLEHLNLNDTNIKTVRLCKILQKNQNISQLYLKYLEVDQDEVALELRNSCQNLEVLDLRCSEAIFTSEGINALADCKNLRKVKLTGVKFNFFLDSWNRLFSSYQHLEEIILSDIIDRTLESLTQCKNLKRLCLSNSMSVTSDKYSVILEKCPKLQEFHLIVCNTNSHLIDQWRERYPHVFIYVESKVSGFLIQE